MIRSRLRILGKDATGVRYFSQCIKSGGMSLSISSDVNLCHLPMVVSAKILHYKFVIFPLGITKYIGGNILR